MWSPSDKPSTCTSLKPIPKNRHDEVKFTFDVSKCDRIFDELAKLGKINFSHTIPSMNELKRRAYCKLHNIFLILPIIAMFFIDKYNRPQMKGRLVIPAMQIDQNHFPVHTIDHKC